jgi:Family of unknown function (DUF5302)
MSESSGTTEDTPTGDDRPTAAAAATDGEPADGSPAPAGGGKPAATEPADSIREQFRLALERKHGQHHGASASGLGPDAKASASTSNSKRQREFRRKSGG